MRRLLVPTVVLVALTGACNDEPVGPVIAIAPDAPITTDDLVLQLIEDATDANAKDELTLAIVWSIDGQVQDDLDDMQVPASRTARDQTWQVEVTADDGKLTSAPVTASVQIANSAPTASVELPASATTLDDLVATASGEDLDGDAISYRFTWTVDGSATAFDSDTVPSTETSRGQVWELEVVPDDGTDEGPAVTASIVIDNTAPTVASAAVAPDPAREADTVSCVGSGWEDPDGDPESYVVAWTVNGTAVAGDTLDGSAFDKGDRLQCTLTPTDGDMEGAAVTSAEVVVQNTPPVVAGITLDPAAPTVAFSVSATADGVTDDDGDTVDLDWAWTVNGTAVGAEGPIIEPRWARGDTLQVTVTPSDDEAAGAPVSTSVVIANSVPVLDTVAIAPALLRTDDVATATYSATDADGDPLTATFAWTVGGASAGTGSTLDGSSAFDKGQVVGLTVTVDDGAGGTASLAASTLTVANTPPSAPGVSIDPSDPSTSDDLVCTLDTASTDADGDRLRYSVSWTLDGSTWTGSTSTTSYAGDTIDASELGDGDEWSCTFVADDGTDTTPGSSTTVTVTDCSVSSSSTVFAGGVQLHGFCWVLGRPGKTCDDVCSSVGGSNLAASASSAFPDSCSRPSSGDVSTWFYDNGNPASWSSTGATAYKTLGYGYTSSQYYGKCAAGTAMGHGTFPGDPNNSSTRALVCPCF